MKWKIYLRAYGTAPVLVEPEIKQTLVSEHITRD
jgi:hypothetical protein